MIQYFFSGLWPLVWHFGTAVGILIICGLVWWFSPSETVKKLAMIVAILTGAGLAGFSLGVRDANIRWEAKWKASVHYGQKDAASARDRAVRDVARGVRDNRDIDPPK